jgi:hypothetical protein
MLKNGARILELSLATAAAINCLLVGVLFGYSQAASAPSSLWPFPGLYLLEIALAGAAGWMGAVRSEGDPTSAWAWLPWIAGGVLSTFVILGGFSIGFYLIPAAAGFTLAGLLFDLRRKALRPTRLGSLLAAAIIQGSLMLILVIFS